MSNVNRTLKKIATACVARMDAQELKGKARDRATLEYFCGAAQTLHETDHPDAQCVLMTTALLITSRGYGEAKKIAESPVTFVPANDAVSFTAFIPDDGRLHCSAQDAMQEAKRTGGMVLHVIGSQREYPHGIAGAELYCTTCIEGVIGSREQCINIVVPAGFGQCCNC